MLRFADPQYFWLLALIPLLLLLFSVSLAVRKKRLKRFGDLATIQQLMPGVSIRRQWVKLSLVCLALAAFAVGLARPQAGVTLKEVKRNGLELIIALDVSNSMLAQDFQPNRLERAKLAISQLVDKMTDDRIGLIVFAGDAYVQLPVTSDYVSAKFFLSSINTSMVSKQGTAIGKAINTAMRSFTLDKGKSKVLVIISDGENHEDDAVAAAQLAANEGIRVYTIGIGSTTGVPIPLKDGVLKDREGNIVMTKLDEATLQQIAEAGGGFYTQANNTDIGLRNLVDEIGKMDKEEFSSRVFQDYDELYMYLFAIAASLLLLEPLLLERKNRWLNSIDLFGVKKKK